MYFQGKKKVINKIGFGTHTGIVFISGLSDEKKAINISPDRHIMFSSALLSGMRENKQTENPESGILPM